MGVAQAKAHGRDGKVGASTHDSEQTPQLNGGMLRG